MGRGLIAFALALCALAAGARAETLEGGLRLPEGDSAWEAYELVAVLDQGFRVTARFMVTNEGPGRHTAVNFGHVVRPGAAPVSFQNGRREGKWRLAENGRRVEIGSSVLVLAADGVRHFEVDNDKRGIKVFLDWQASASARSAPELIPGYRIDVLELATPVRASIQVADMPAARVLKGTLALTRTRAPVSEADLVQRRSEAVGVEPGSPFYLVELIGAKGAHHGWLSLGTGADASSRAEVRSEGPSVGAEGYAVSKVWKLSGPDWSGSLTLGDSMLEVDPLGALPTFLRMVYSLRGRPHRSWIDAHFELSLATGPDQPARRLSGAAIAVLTFLDRFPPAHP